MKICLLFLGTTGAGPVYSFEIARALALRNDVELQVIVSNTLTNLQVWKDSLKYNNVSLFTVTTYNHSNLSLALSFFQFWKHNKLIKLINQFNPDAVYLPFGFSWSPVIFPRLKNKYRIIRTLHDPHPHDNYKNFMEAFFYKSIDWANKYVDDVVILNSKDLDYVKSNICPNAYVIPHASFSYYTRHITINENNILKGTIGFFCRIEPYKGLDLLVDAFEQLDSENIKLIIAGSGLIEEELLKKIKSNNRIELINRYILDDEFSVLLNRVDFVVLPYKRASQSGVIPLAFAYGKPVVATNVGALDEQVPDGTGLLVSPTSNDVAKAIDDLYSNKDIINKMGIAAKEYAAKELSWEHSAKLLIGIIKNDENTKED